MHDCYSIFGAFKIRALGLFIKKTDIDQATFKIQIIIDLLKKEILIESKTFHKPFVTRITYISKSQQILFQELFFIREIFVSNVRDLWGIFFF